jgi:hypothetical protein
MDQPNNRGFDRVEVRQGDGSSRSMTRAEYDAMPLSERISLVLQRQVEFYRGAVKVSAHEALKL